MKKNIIKTLIKLVILMCLTLTAYAENVNRTLPKPDKENENDDSAASDYTIGVDDIIDISILQPEKIMTTVSVTPDGYITFPYIGNVQAKGMTLPKLQTKIQTMLAEGYMKYPVVSVSLRESRSRKFAVSGDVLRPGVYHIEENTTILKAIYIAGGFATNSNSSQIKILRLKKNNIGYETITMSGNDISNDVKHQNLLIQPGDVIEVLGGKFHIYGEVLRPGAFPIEENLTLQKALSSAGIVTRDIPLSWIKILKPEKNKKGYEVVKISTKDLLENSNIQDILIQAGDTIEVLKEEGNFYINGEVARPGMYPIIEENLTLLKAISSAGGYVRDVLITYIKITKHKKNKESEIIKINYKDLKQDTAKQNLSIQAGDVIEVFKEESKLYIYGEIAKPGIYPIVEDNLTLLKLISMAGGYTRFGFSGQIKIVRSKKDTTESETIIINSKDLKDNNTKQNIIINPGDVVEIVEEDKFYVSGEVIKPGTYIIEENTTLLKAISIAGGFIKYDPYITRIKILRSKKDKAGLETIKINVKDLLEGVSDQNLNILSGDVIDVSKEEERKFYVYGEIPKPGVYPIIGDNPTLSKALSLAGGITNNSSPSWIKISKTGKDKSELKISVKDFKDGNYNQNLIIQNEDIIELLIEGKFSVSGDVLRPGTYYLEESTTILKAISIAGGFSRYASSSLVKITRQKKDKSGIEAIKLNVKEILDSTNNEELVQVDDSIEVSEGKYYVYGEVSKPGVYPFIEENATVLKAITIAGGFNKYGSSSQVKILRPLKDKQGYETIKVNIKSVISNDNMDITLQPGDVIVVSEGMF